MKMWVLALMLISLVVLTSCNENFYEAPKPAESDPQFVLERKMVSSTYPNIYVFRDKTNGVLIYMSEKGGIAVSGSGFVEEEKKNTGD